jgi:hypothetical protein
VIQVKVLPVKDFAAILTRILVAFKDVMPGELYFLFRLPIIHEEQDDPGHANSEGNALHGIFTVRIFGNVPPFLKIEGAKRTVGMIEDDLGVPLENEGKSAPSCADVDRLP